MIEASPPPRCRYKFPRLLSEWRPLLLPRFFSPVLKLWGRAFHYAQGRLLSFVQGVTMLRMQPARLVLRAKSFSVGSPVPALRNVREGRTSTRLATSQFKRLGHPALWTF